MDFRLDRSVQFLYEGHLAWLEFKSLGCERLSRDAADWRLFRGSMNGTRDLLVERSAYLGTTGGLESVYSRLIRPGYQGGLFNRTRSANQYLTHWIYPYRGKFHPQMVRALFNIMGAEPGMRIGDFFSGSGTTALEASLFGLNFVGRDLSWLCVLLGRVKTQSVLVADEISHCVDEVLRSDGPLTIEVLNSGQFSDDRISEFFEVARMVVLSDIARRKRVEDKSIRKNLAGMAQSVNAHATAVQEFDLQLGDVELEVGDARSLKGIQDDSLDFIVTSPPYSIALDYVENDAHALEALEVDIPNLRSKMKGVRGGGAKEKLDLYNQDMRAAFDETARVLKSGGRAAFVIGDATVNGREYTTTEDMAGWAGESGLLLEQAIDKIVYGLYAVMKDEKILILRK